MANINPPAFLEFCASYERGEPTRVIAERMFPRENSAAREAKVRSAFSVLVASGVLEKRRGRRRITEERRQQLAAMIREQQAKAVEARKKSYAEFRAWKAERAQRLAAE